MVDVVGVAVAVVQLDLRADDRLQIARFEDPRLEVRLALQPAVELVAPDATQVVAAAVEEQRVKEPARVLQRRRVAGAQPAVELEQRFCLVRRRLAEDRRVDVLVVRVRVDVRVLREDALVRAELRLRHALFLIDRPEQRRHRDLPLAVHLDGQHVLVAGLELQPGASIRDQLAVAQLAAARRVSFTREVDARRTHELRDHDALGAVDDEGPVRRHEREVAHEQLLLLHLARLADDQLHVDLQRRRERHVALAALELRVLRLAERVLAKAELHPGPRKVGDRRDLVEQLAEAFLLEPLERIELNADQVRDVEDVCNLRIRFFLLRNQRSSTNDVRQDSHSVRAPSLTI